MPLPLAIPVGLLLGMTLAWLAREELARSEVPLLLARPFLVALGLGLFVLAPVTGYFAAWHGDWTYLYVVPASRVPSAVDLLLVVVAAAQVPLGFALVTPWAITRRGSRIFQAMAVAFVVIVAVAALASRRLAVSASFAQFHGGYGGLPLGKSSLGRGILLSWIAVAVAYAWSAHALRSARER
jgi:hypothetical protein